jgi:hypothetical protein
MRQDGCQQSHHTRGDGIFFLPLSMPTPGEWKIFPHGALAKSSMDQDSSKIQTGFRIRLYWPKIERIALIKLDYFLSCGSLIVFEYEFPFKINMRRTFLLEILSVRTLRYRWQFE